MGKNKAERIDSPAKMARRVAHHERSAYMRDDPCEPQRKDPKRRKGTLQQKRKSIMARGRKRHLRHIRGRTS